MGNNENAITHLDSDFFELITFAFNCKRIGGPLSNNQIDRANEPDGMKRSDRTVFTR